MAGFNLSPSQGFYSRLWNQAPGMLNSAEQSFGDPNLSSASQNANNAWQMRQSRLNSGSGLGRDVLNSGAQNRDVLNRDAGSMFGSGMNRTIQPVPTQISRPVSQSINTAPSPNLGMGMGMGSGGGFGASMGPSSPIRGFWNPTGAIIDPEGNSLNTASNSGLWGAYNKYSGFGDSSNVFRRPMYY